MLDDRDGAGIDTHIQPCKAFQTCAQVMLVHRTGGEPLDGMRTLDGCYAARPKFAAEAPARDGQRPVGVGASLEGFDEVGCVNLGVVRCGL